MDMIENVCIASALIWCLDGLLGYHNVIDNLMNSSQLQSAVSSLSYTQTPQSPNHIVICSSSPSAARHTSDTRPSKHPS